MLSHHSADLADYSYYKSSVSQIRTQIIIYIRIIIHAYLFSDLITQVTLDYQEFYLHNQLPVMLR